MNFDFSHDNQQMQRTLRRFVDERVLPANVEWHRVANSGASPTSVIEPLKQEAKSLGLWNLFLPGLHDDEPGVNGKKWFSTGALHPN